MDEKTALVLGATGGIGGEVARQLRDAGWQVRAMARRDPSAGQANDGISWVRGDAMNEADVVAAADGCRVLVHGVNPPGYKRWDELVVPMVENSIAAAKQNNATIVLPGTVYNFGPDAFPLLQESAAQQPLTRKGAIRVELEQRLQAHAEAGGQAIIVRAGDFFGPHAGNNWFGGGMVTAGKPVGRILNPGKPGIGHQWAYVPDVARTMLMLLTRRDELESFACYHFGGHWDADGMTMATSIQDVVAAAGGKKPTITALPWWALQVAGLFNETMRELQEMRYLWNMPVRLDNSKLVALLGSEPHTPLDEAVAKTLAGLQCLPTAGTRAASPSPGTT